MQTLGNDPRVGAPLLKHFSGLTAVLQRLCCLVNHERPPHGPPKFALSEAQREDILLLTQGP